MDRCAAAYAYHKQGYNCAQSVAGAFADLTGTAPEQLMAMAFESLAQNAGRLRRRRGRQP